MARELESTGLRRTGMSELCMSEVCGAAPVVCVKCVLETDTNCSDCSVLPLASSLRRFAWGKCRRKAAASTFRVCAEEGGVEGCPCVPGLGGSAVKSVITNRKASDTSTLEQPPQLRMCPCPLAGPSREVAPPPPPLLMPHKFIPADPYLPSRACWKGVRTMVVCVTSLCSNVIYLF
ncbi:unnamed protein product [Protopolystoma xenopodis]|uniref:Uncharacterized protein n=1 Tax=Protopolystoma xenopodis TaxID=117903 RepID=A0A3S5B3P8_9PLAT|nr:unnamed protein product [Protopolystoma xenopodis]